MLYRRDSVCGSGHVRALSAMCIAVSIGCGDAVTCILPPCPALVAVSIELVVPTGQRLVPPVSIVDLKTGTTVTCDPQSTRTCRVMGQPRDYSLEIRASGFLPARWQGTVSAAETPRCSCAKPNTQSGRVELIPAPHT